MRALLSNLHSMLGSLTLSLGLLILTACTTDHYPAVEPPEINTFNAYVNHESNTINYYTIENNSLETHRIASFEPAENGFQNTLFLDLIEDKQGYEFVAFVTKDSRGDSTINLVDLDKDTKAKHYELLTISSHLCGITGVFEPTTSMQKQSQISTKHSPVITLHISNSSDCSEPLYYETIEFANLIDDDTTNDNVFDQRFVEDSKSNQMLIYSIENYGYLSYNESSSELNFNYSETIAGTTNEKSWSTLLAYEDPMTFTQASSNYILFQQGRNLYVVPSVDLFTVDDLDSSSNTPVQARIDALFITPTMVLAEGVDPEIKTNTPLQANSFILQVENDLYIFQDGVFKLVHSNLKGPDEVALSYLINSEDDILLLSKEDEELDTLTTISSIGIESTILLAEEIDIALNNDTFYVNTLNEVADAGNQVHILKKKKNNFEITTIDNSTLVFAYDMTQESDFPLLISSEPVKNVSGTRQLTGFYLYQFDEDKDNGRALGTSSRENEKGKTEHRAVDFSYGTFDKLSNLVYQEGLVINNHYGVLHFEATAPSGGIEQTATFSFVFNPLQETPDPDLEDQSLTLLLVNGG